MRVSIHCYHLWSPWLLRSFCTFSLSFELSLRCLDFAEKLPMLKVKVFLNLAYNDVIRKVLLKGRFGLVDWRMTRQTAFSARPCAAAAVALSTRLCGGPCCLL